MSRPELIYVSKRAPCRDMYSTSMLCVLWQFYPYPPGLLHCHSEILRLSKWHWSNLTDMDKSITWIYLQLTSQPKRNKAANPSAYFLRCTVRRETLLHMNIASPPAGNMLYIDSASFFIVFMRYWWYRIPVRWWVNIIPNGWRPRSRTTSGDFENMNKQ